MFNIKPKPTFEAIVEIPVPGSEPQPLCLVFKHKNRKEVAEFFDAAGQAEVVDAKVLSGIVADWKDVEADGAKVNFSLEALQDVLDNYHSAVIAIFKTYGEQLAEGRRKN